MKPLITTFNLLIMKWSLNLCANLTREWSCTRKGAVFYLVYGNTQASFPRYPDTLAFRADASQGTFTSYGHLWYPGLLFHLRANQRSPAL